MACEMASGSRSSESATISSAILRFMPHLVASLTMHSAVTLSAFCALASTPAPASLSAVASSAMAAP